MPEPTINHALEQHHLGVAAYHSGKMDDAINLFRRAIAMNPTKTPPPGVELIDWTNDLNDFADTAALIANLDFVITIDTAVAHLAGAMNKQVWTLLPSVPDWRWLLDHEHTPWYPSMRLFRQPALGDWDNVIKRVKGALSDRMMNRAIE